MADKQRKPTAAGRRLNELGSACLEARAAAVRYEAEAAEASAADDTSEARRLSVLARRARRDAESLYEETFAAAKGLLIRFVNKFRNDKRGASYFNEEYLLAARAAFAEAFEKWDPDKGSLSTILVYRLRSHVFSEVARFERGGVSMHTFDAERSVSSALAAADDENLTDEELAEASGQTLETVQTIRRARNASLSLNARIGEDGDEYGDLLPADTAVTFDDTNFALSDELRSRYTKLIFQLVDNFTTAWMLVRRLGLDGEGPASFSELGDMTGIAGETARTRCQAAQASVEAWIRGDAHPADPRPQAEADTDAVEDSEPEKALSEGPHRLEFSAADVAAFEQLVLFAETEPVSS